MKCPRCGKVLRTIGYEGIQVETCDGCQGEWLDATELGHVVRTREIRFDADERRAVAAATKIKGVEIEVQGHELACPKCGGETHPLNYGGDTGIIIDKCTDCQGIWLDGGELEKVQMVVEGWKDGLDDDLAKYGARLRKVAEKVDREDDVKISRFGFVNSIINGILDVF